MLLLLYYSCFCSCFCSQESWRLDIAANPENGIMKEYSFTLQELKDKFQKHEVVATLQCAGKQIRLRKKKKKEIPHHHYQQPLTIKQ